MVTLFIAIHCGLLEHRERVFISESPCRELPPASAQHHPGRVAQGLFPGDTGTAACLALGTCSEPWEELPAPPLPPSQDPRFLPQIWETYREGLGSQGLDSLALPWEQKVSGVVCGQCGPSNLARIKVPGSSPSPHVA